MKMNTVLAFAVALSIAFVVSPVAAAETKAAGFNTEKKIVTLAKDEVAAKPDKPKKSKKTDGNDDNNGGGNGRPAPDSGDNSGN